MQIDNKRLAQVSTGLGLYGAFNWVFDQLVYPTVIAVYGVIQGGLAMSALSMAQCSLVLVFYEHQKIEWLGLDAVDVTKEKSIQWLQALDCRKYRNALIRFSTRIFFFLPRTVLRFVLWLLTRGDIPSLLGLSLLTDPFITTAYLRRGAFNGLRRKDWLVFIVSGIIANAYWSIRCLGLVVLAKYVWNETQFEGAMANALFQYLMGQY